MGKFAQRIDIDCVTSLINGGRNCVEAIETGRATLVVSDVATNGSWGSDDGVMWLGCCHKCVEICDCTRWNAEFSISGTKDFTGKFLRDDFNLLDGT